MTDKIDTKPEALRLADEFENCISVVGAQRVAAELRRLHAENAAQAQQIAQLGADAARYGWLRQGDNDERAMSGDCRGLYLPRREFLDAVIDREMAKDANATWAPVSAEQAAAIDSALGIARAAASGASQGDDHAD